MTETPPAATPDDQAKGFNARFSRGLNWFLAKLKVEEVPHIKRIITTVVGGTILFFGVVMFFTPGPGIVVVFAGFAVLGTEYAWARRWLRRGRVMAKKAVTQTQKILAPKEKTSGADRVAGNPQTSSEVVDDWSQ